MILCGSQKRAAPLVGEGEKCAIREMPEQLQSQKQVQRLLGVMGFLRNLHMAPADTTGPLTRLLPKGAPFVWTQEHIELAKQPACSPDRSSSNSGRANGLAGSFPFSSSDFTPIFTLGIASSTASNLAARCSMFIKVTRRHLQCYAVVAPYLGCLPF